MMSFKYQPDREGIKMYLIPNEGSAEKQISVRGNSGDLYLVEPVGAQSELLWWDPEMRTLCNINASLPAVTCSGLPVRSATLSVVTAGIGLAPFPYSVACDILLSKSPLRVLSLASVPPAA